MVRLEPDTTVTVADPEALVSACDFAITETVGGEGTLEGAVYKPLAEILPHEPLQPASDHVTAVFVVPVTLAVNCWWPAVGTCAEPGDTETVIADAAAITTLADADLLVSAFDVAVTVATAGVGTVAGAV